VSRASPGRFALLAAVLGLTWAWYAPQDIVIALGAGALAACAWRYRFGPTGLERRIGAAAMAFVVAVAIGATQAGPLLPKAWREDIAMWTQEVEPTLRFAPSAEVVRNHWTTPRFERVPGGAYEAARAKGREIGPDEAYRHVAWLFEESLWISLRTYGFPL